jgi:hypothetical protein
LGSFELQVEMERDCRLRLMCLEVDDVRIGPKRITQRWFLHLEIVGA